MNTWNNVFISIQSQRNNSLTNRWSLTQRNVFALCSFFYRHSIHFDTYVCLQSDEHRHSNKAHVNKQAQRPLSKEIQRINTDLCIFHKRIFSLFTLGLLLLTHFIALKVQSACNCLLKSVSNDSFQCVNKVMRYW